ncbi:unnamed protein product [Alopecurus aequalis]
MEARPDSAVEIFITVLGRATRPVNHFVVANGLTFLFSTFAARFRVRELEAGVFCTAVVDSRVASVILRRRAFVFAGVVFRLLRSPPACAQRADFRTAAGPAWVFGSLAFPPCADPEESFSLPFRCGGPLTADSSVPTVSNARYPHYPACVSPPPSRGCSPSLASATPPHPESTHDRSPSSVVDRLPRSWVDVAKLSSPPATPLPLVFPCAFPFSPPAPRRRLIRPARACFRCYSPQHLVKDCRDPLTCRLCRRCGHRARGCPDRHRPLSAPPAPMASRLHHLTLTRQQPIAPPARPLMPSPPFSPISHFELGAASSDESTHSDVPGGGRHPGQLESTDAVEAEPAVVPSHGGAGGRYKRGCAVSSGPARTSARLTARTPALFQSALDRAVAVKAARLDGTRAPRHIPPPLTSLEIKSMAAACQLPTEAVHDLDAVLGSPDCCLLVTP